MSLDYPFYDNIIIQNNPYHIDTLINKYYQLPQDFLLNDLVDINDQYSSLQDYSYLYRHQQARFLVYQDYQALRQLCLTHGISLYVISGYRSFQRQVKTYQHMLTIYNQERVDQTCSRPGHSEHTTGLALDIGLDSYQFENIINHPQYSWFLLQLSNYGFIIRYPPDKQDYTGYHHESWHLRYLGKELAKKVEQSGLTFDEYYARYLMDSP